MWNWVKQALCIWLITAILSVRIHIILKVSYGSKLQLEKLAVLNLLYYGVGGDTVMEESKSETEGEKPTNPLSVGPYSFGFYVERLKNTCSTYVPQAYLGTSAGLNYLFSFPEYSHEASSFPPILIRYREKLKFKGTCVSW